MTIFIILATVLLTVAITCLVYFLVKFASAWWQQQWTIANGEEVQAQIVQIEVMDDENRYIPFVRMQVEVNQTGELLRSAEGFYPRSYLPYLQVGNFVSAFLHPNDKGKVLLVKDQFKTPGPKETTAVLSIPPKRKLYVA